MKTAVHRTIVRVLPFAISVAFSACSGGYSDDTSMSINNDDSTNISADTSMSTNDDGSSDSEFGEARAPLCANGDGVSSAMAGLAVATAKELHRWSPSTDFVTDSNYRLALSATGKAQCADGKCWNTQAILDLQKASLGMVKFGSTTFNADNFRSQLYAAYGAQKDCEARAGAPGSNCPAEAHKLTFQSAAKGACDTLFTFTATTPSGGNLSSPSLLKNKLMYVGSPNNQYLQFSTTGTTVTIDPTYGLDDDGTVSTAACTVACTKVSPTSVAGQCCSCNGVTKAYVQSAWSASTFLCR